MEEQEEPYGIDKDYAHPRALELAPEDFFWDCGDELAPFGSDEGDMALSEFREWRKENPALPVIDCLVWTIESVGEMPVEEYSDALLSESKITAQIADKDFDDAQYIYVLDTSVIATGFAQLVDEGQIDAACKPFIQRAIQRLTTWSELTDSMLPQSNVKEYHAKLQVLQRILQQA
ncbi:hypothetical protein E5K00_08020 [Hymenobacter aquaticus]|uniref:Uncharacterized protein n=1 Tax=Hymenobacter aquaticus TaxID=1867101 RepID=A0A4Z0Q7K5_9BACT|nr:hypothetical protein [Hymenobacter aquaticus]TGE25133.1 hypothetical protein E5K00_08020 [Hymenobacter aquaticus]